MGKIVTVSNCGCSGLRGFGASEQTITLPEVSIVDDRVKPMGILGWSMVIAGGLVVGSFLLGKKR